LNNWGMIVLPLRGKVPLRILSLVYFTSG